MLLAYIFVALFECLCKYNNKNPEIDSKKNKLTKPWQKKITDP